MIAFVLAIMQYQLVVRNPQMAEEKLKLSNRWLHYGLGFYYQLVTERSLASMQALALVLVHIRNMPKPGFTWYLSQQLLNLVIEMNYHRSKVPVPGCDDGNPLSQELRRRVFWTILVVNVATGAKLGRPMPLRMEDMDVEYPLPRGDAEISDPGIASARSGRCNFWPAYYVAKLVPLQMSLYNNVVSVRKPHQEYLKDVDLLDREISQWRQDWVRETAEEPQTPTMQIASCHIDTWAAEFQLVLHHPRLCPITTAEMTDKNLEACYSAATRSLRNLQLLRKYMAMDLTWHGNVSYVLALATTIQIHSRRKDQMTKERFKALKQELTDWMSIMEKIDIKQRK